jgi:hypothetical protein
MSERTGPAAGPPTFVPALPPGATMAIWPVSALAAGDSGEEAPPPLYVSGGRWLHPLFDLLELLFVDSAAGPSGQPETRAALTPAGDLFLRDRVIGRGAAFLILRAGIRNAWADVVSDGAMALFEAHGATLGGAERVASIGCRTEELLREVEDPDVAWTLLLQRRAAAALRG